jgi:DNA-directed RNA polymerase subunit K/omega
VNVKAIPMSDLYKVCDDVYESVMVIAQRAKQIIDQRVIPIDETEEVEDSILYQEPEIKVDSLDKPMVQALGEYMENELEWRQPSEDDLQSNGS